MSEAESGFVETVSHKSTLSCASTHCSTLPCGVGQDSVVTVHSLSKRTCDSGTVTCSNDKRSKKDLSSPSDTNVLHQLIPQLNDHFTIVSKIGEGTFSTVYLATLKDHSSAKVALKHIIPSSSSTRIENEIRCLKMMGGKDNVMAINACMRHKDHTVLILPYFPHDKFTDYICDMTIEEIRLYMKALFLALSHVHKHRIIHRDIKPSNFLYNRTTKRFQLIDFGLAHLDTSHYNKKSDSSYKKVFKGVVTSSTDTNKRPSTKRSRTNDNGLVGEVLPSGSTCTSSSFLCPTRHSTKEVCGFCLARSSQVAPRAGTPGFRAPEVLMKCTNQTTGVDMWSAGVILLCILSQRYPFFRAPDDQTALAQIVSLMGSVECTEAALTCGKELLCHPSLQQPDLKALCHKLRGTSPPTPSFSPNKRQCPVKTDHDIEILTEILPDSLFDLLYQCLQLNPHIRPPATTALKHPFIVNGQ